LSSLVVSILLVLSCLFTQTALAQTAHFSEALARVPGGAGGTPYGLAVDGQGHIYVADTYRYVYGLNYPYGVAVDAAGNVYYTYSLLNQVVKVAPDGSQTTLPLTGLGNPEGIAVDGHGNVFIADYLNDRILEAIPSPGTYTQTVVPTRRLDLPAAVAVDGSGNLYIADTDNYRVLKETVSGSGWSESIVANLDDTQGTPTSIAADAAGDVFILQFQVDNQFLVLKETLSGGVYTQSVVPSYGQDPYAIATDPAGNLYMNSPYFNYPNSGILEVFAGPTATLLPISVTGASYPVSLVFNFDAQTTLGSPVVVTQGDTGLDFTNAGSGTCGAKKTSYVYNAGDSCFVNVVFKPQVSGSRYGAVTLQDASGTPLASAYLSGTGVAPQISFPPGSQLSISTGLTNPSGVAVDAAGNVFVADTGTGNVYKETVSGNSFARSTIASGLNQPSGLALDGVGNVYVVASGGVYKETSAHGGYAQTQIATDLTDLVGIAVDRGGSLYLTSSVAGDVHKETLGTNGSYVESGIGYGISSPTGVAVDGSGDVFMLNAKDGELYIETPQPNGGYLQTTFYPQVATPQYLAVDGNGNVYVSDSSHGEIKKFTRQANGSYLETLARSGLTMPSGLAVDGHGNLYCAQGTGQLAMIDVSDAPALVLTATKPETTVTQEQTVVNIGNDTLAFPPPASGTNASISGTAFALGTASTCPRIGVSGAPTNLDAGSSCVYDITFTPPSQGTFSGLLSLTDNNLNLGVEQDITLSGASSADATRTTMRVSPNPVTVNLGVTIIVTVTDTYNPAVIDQGDVTLTDTVGSQVVSLNGGAPVALSNGTAQLTMTPSVSGTHTITAHYGGVDASFLASTGTATLTVQP
jgi:sugar lactone lactonase YvrE